uniref:GH16 domain-containing protein n=1 Tax=Ditylum brightwellii TaxID=49249 RepID=A0A7S1YUS6_9STRA|mmetsp:Transcript_18178/g.27165  ORF Transcript_18178/g.27165 Transcript_18178/m.27165 type:complete len:678 (+) Transcript_18178:110-2143(+)
MGQQRQRVLGCNVGLGCALLAAISLNSAKAGWVDVDTPTDKLTATSLIDGSEYELVMSDEFEVEGRNFKDGSDPMWTALDKSDDDASAAGGGSLHFYNSSTVTTEDGMMKISSKLGKTKWTHYDPIKKEYKKVTKYFKSGMVQSWNKFCFTGGIVEVDLVLPGDPFIGGLWPAVWMLGNLGRATYEASTNNIWPWSFDTCDRDLQHAQHISACNNQNHFGLNPKQGRGATEIDLLELMAGDSDGPLPATEPPISLPYLAMTLQVAPGIPDNRPQSGAQPRRNDTTSANGHTQLLAQSWYDDLVTKGNTSINPFFYGTYLAETKPEEPVQRTKKEAFQADAIGSMHQVAQEHFLKPYTYRVEWQPGRGGRLDWFAKKVSSADTENSASSDDDDEDEWVHAFSIPDKSIGDLMGSQIPNEPSYLILNTGISSTWAFPYDVPEWCTKCYDCDDPNCACSFNPGFCKMMKSGNVAMKIDSIRVYQSKNDTAHPGNKHTVGCDLPEYPTREYIKGHEYLYVREPPFSYTDTGPLEKIKVGGGSCQTDEDCGGHLTPTARGRCTLSSSSFWRGQPTNKCQCNDGFTGPHCLAVDHNDDTPGVYDMKKKMSLFDHPRAFMWNTDMVIFVGILGGIFVGVLITKMGQRVDARRKGYTPVGPGESTRPANRGPLQFEDLIVTGRSI